MVASPKQMRTEPTGSVRKPRVVKGSDAARKGAALTPASHTTDDDITAVDWRDELQVRLKVSAWAASEQEELQLTEYIESRAPKWIKELEQIADLALRPLDDLPPDCDLAAKILLGLVSCRASAGSG